MFSLSAKVKSVAESSYEKAWVNEWNALVQEEFVNQMHVNLSKRIHVGLNSIREVY